MIPVSSILILASASLVGCVAIFGLRQGLVNWLAVICMTAFLALALVVGCAL